MTAADTELSPEELRDIHAVPHRTTAAWAVGDADAFAAEFADDARVVIAGVYLRNHEHVLSYIRTAFAGPVKGTEVVTEPVETLRLDASTVLITTEGGVKLPGEPAVSPERALRGTWVLGRRGGQWQIAAYHSSPIKSLG